MTESGREGRLVALVVLALGLLLIVPFLTMGVGMMGGGMWGPGMQGGTAPEWMWAVGFLFQGLFLSAILVLGYLVYRAVGDGDARADPAIGELREAYARGDLSEDEYDRRLDRLRESSDDT